MDNRHFSNPEFPLLDQYFGLRLGADLASLTPGETVVESPRRLKKELSYGYIHALWWVWLADGRSAISVPPGAGLRFQDLTSGTHSAEKLHAPGLADQLKPPIDAALIANGLDATDRSICGVRFACNAKLLRRHYLGDCRQLYDGSVPPAEDFSLPTHCFPDGIVHAVIADGVVASTAYPHRSHLMAHSVADIGIETAPTYRRRGYAKTVLSAVVHHITRVGGEAIYGTGPDNEPSIATARSAGFIPYAKSLILSSNSPDAAHQPPPLLPASRR